MQGEIQPPRCHRSPNVSPPCLDAQEADSGPAAARTSSSPVRPSPRAQCSDQAVDIQDTLPLRHVRSSPGSIRRRRGEILVSPPTLRPKIRSTATAGPSSKHLFPRALIRSISRPTFHRLPLLTVISTSGLAPLGFFSLEPFETALPVIRPHHSEASELVASLPGHSHSLVSLRTSQRRPPLLPCHHSSGPSAVGPASARLSTKPASLPTASHREVLWETSTSMPTPS